MQRDESAVQAYLVFQVGENEFAVSLARVRQILSAESLQGAEGMVRYGGRALDVLDMRDRLAIVGRPSGQRSIIVLGEDARHRGILVDSAPIVTSIEPSHVRPLPDIVRSPNDPYEGVARLGDGRLVIILDSERL